MLKSLIAAMSVTLLQLFISPLASASTLVFYVLSADPSVVFGQTTLVNWTVVQGNVDVLDPGWCGVTVPGKCLDLDGSYVSDLALMQTKTEFLFESGLEYRLVVTIPAVNTDPSNPDASRYDGFRVGVGSLLSETFPNGSYGVPLLIDRTFTPGADEQARIVIELLDGRDFIGPLLSEVELQQVPEPSVALLAAAGLALCRLETPAKLHQAWWRRLTQVVGPGAR
jgi:hypothetical protein